MYETRHLRNKITVRTTTKRKTPILQLIDRRLNSSTPSDALDSIRENIESTLQHADKKEKEQDGDEEEKEPPVLSLVSTLIESHDFMISLCSILCENQFSSSSSSSRALILEVGSSVICELLLMNDSCSLGPPILIVKGGCTITASIKHTVVQQ